MSVHTKKGTDGLPAFSFPDDKNTGLNSDTADVLDLVAGGAVGLTVTTSGPQIAGLPVIPLSGISGISVSIGPKTITASSGSGNKGGWANPFGYPVIITRAQVKVDTVATGSCALDVGIGATISASNDGLFDGLDVNAATGLFDSSDATNRGTNGRPSIYWAANTFLTVTASASTAGLVGKLFVQCIPA